MARPLIKVFLPFRKRVNKEPNVKPRFCVQAETVKTPFRNLKDDVPRHPKAVKNTSNQLLKLAKLFRAS